MIRLSFIQLNTCLKTDGYKNPLYWCGFLRLSSISRSKMWIIPQSQAKFLRFYQSDKACV